MLSSAEIASMTAVVAASLDVTITVTRDTSKVEDTYGHTTSGGTTSFTAQVNVYKPTATQLQTYAGIIGSQEAVMIRFMPTSGIREGDAATYASKQWKIQKILDADSYTFANDALMITTG
jgi:hypothetical protein